MTSFLGVADPEAVALAVRALGEGSVVAIPTDTVYGLGADAFTPAAVTALLAAKGRGRNMPPPAELAHRAAVLT